MNARKPNVTPVNRTQRERELRALYSRMQRPIDASRDLIWTQFFGEFAFDPCEGAPAVSACPLANATGSSTHL